MYRGTLSAIQNTINVASDHQPCITYSTMHHIIKAVLHHQPAFHCQQNITFLGKKSDKTTDF